ncbi:MAG: SIMPL domain-containing protein [Orrella sp.]
MSAFSEKIVPAVLVAVGLAVAGWTVGEGLQSFRDADRYITIKGLAEQDVKSDFAIWTVSFRRAAADYDDVRQQLTDDREAVIAFLQDQGFAESDIEGRPLQINDLLARDYGQQDVTFRYTGTGAVTVRSDNVDAVSKAANSIDPLIKLGVQMSQEGPMGGAPRYFLRGFNDIKPLLLEQAIDNATEQAEKFASDAGAVLGGLKRADQGTIQILDDDGSDGYTTGQTIGKRLRVVSTFVYSLD